MNKGFFYFIVFDVFLAILLIFNFNFKNHNEGQGLFTSFSAWVDSQSAPLTKATDSPTNQIAKPQVELPNKAVNNTNLLTSTTPATLDNKSNVLLNNSIDSNKVVTNGNSINRNNTDGVCISYGPLNLEQKVALDLILNSNKINNQFYVENKLPLFSVYWNLGKDKLQAIDLFEKQKNDGALQDEKFKLTQNLEGEWIVPITTVSGNAELAQKMTNELAKSSKSFGGKWEYKPKSEGYFYRFKDITALPNKTVETINHSINTTKTPC